MAELTNFEKLEIYQLSERLSELVWKIVSKWERLAQNTVGGQLIRSADSIGANIAEGNGRGSDKDYLRFLKISRGSLYETKHWLRRAYRRELLSAENSDELRLILAELLPKQNAYIRAVSRPKLPTPQGQNSRTKAQSPKTKDQSPE